MNNTQRHGFLVPEISREELALESVRSFGVYSGSGTPNKPKPVEARQKCQPYGFRRCTRQRVHGTRKCDPMLVATKTTAAKLA